MHTIQKQKISPFLWFNDNAEEAAIFYTSIFKHSKILSVHRMPMDGYIPKGTVMSATFVLEGQLFHALNGGPKFPFTPAISLFVDCETQEEVDTLWEALSTGGEEERCGWVTDKFGLSWQIIPTELGALLHSKETERASRAMQAMLQMKKIDIDALKEAYSR